MGNMIDCRQCGKPVADRGIYFKVTCPHCGEPTPNQKAHDAGKNMFYGFLAVLGGFFVLCMGAIVSS